MVSAYVLVKLQGGSDPAQLQHVGEHPEIASLKFVLGPYDVILECRVESWEALGKLAQQLRSCPGVAESVTCPIMV